jgi:hypothetical protein
MDSPLCTLALFLDPRYRDAVCPPESDNFSRVLKEVPNSYGPC